MSPVHPKTGCTDAESHGASPRHAAMSDTLPEALRLAAGNEECAKAWLESSDAHKFRLDTAAELRRLHAVEQERDRLRARLDRAIAAAEEHFGEDAIRYKLSLHQTGRARNLFPPQLNGKWVALQRADNDAHVGLGLRCKEAEAENARLKAEVEGLRKGAGRYAWIRHRASGLRDKLGNECFCLVAPDPCAATIMRGSVAQHLDVAIDAALAGSAGEG